ncbi:Hsp20/alpha crystallin family protein [Dyella sp. 2HG41-7]|uniref:Hsp20/alpha crystallin family protein n=1 Tax=Dyella sp. 2HG41-7 TaxID=2883239 RepID=UPI001F465650|nr:Hsp20/alpha crystallin family protein [Dyella sp. 2HG41-7]
MRPHDPVKQLFDRVFERHPRQDVSPNDATVVARQWVPLVDIKEEPHRFIFYVDAPGIDLKTVDVHMERGVLTIKGERKTESQESRDSFMRIERRHGTFHRRFALPSSADPHNMTVTAHHGILYVIVRKRPPSASRQIRMDEVGTHAYGRSEGDPIKPLWRPA